MDPNMDRISRLPDDVICHILSFLPTKHAVATSVLSSRWVNLWTFVPVIDLDDSLYLNPERKDSSSELFIRFIERVLSLNQSQTIAKFHLYMHDSCEQTLSRINGFIQNVFLKNVVEVNLGIVYDFPDYDGCLEIPHSESLKVLTVRTDFSLKFPVFPGCFPSLGLFFVEASLDNGDEWFTNLFPCLPALERLYLVGESTDRTGEFVVNIGGAALKHLELELFNYSFNECDAMVVIDAPNLEYLKLQDNFLASYLVKNKPAISEVVLNVGAYDERFLGFLAEAGPTRLTCFDGLLHSLVNTKCISVTSTTLKVLFSQRWNIPVFPSLTKLDVDVRNRTWVPLLHWLESCPNLKVLSVTIMEESVEEDEEVVPDLVPSCISSCVKEIEILRAGGFTHGKMLIYLWDNAEVLDKFTLDSCVLIKDGIVQ